MPRCGPAKTRAADGFARRPLTPGLTPILRVHDHDPGVDLSSTNITSISVVTKALPWVEEGALICVVICDAADRRRGQHQQARGARQGREVGRG